MLKVIAGKYGSRILKSLPGMETRPTLDKTKGAIFNRIGPFFDGGIFLDLFGGSGAMGIEALSRGVSKAVFVEKSPRAASIIKENLKMLEATGESEVHVQSYKSYLLSTEEHFDYVYLDPPYKMKEAYGEAVSVLAERNLLNPDAIVIFESAKEISFEEELSGLLKEKEVIYGQSRITYYRKGE